MIGKIDIKDKERFLYLGKLISDKFDKLYNLDIINKDKNNMLIGYYIDNILIGFIHILIAVDSIDVINIVVDSEYRRKGVASKLIEYVYNKYGDRYNYYLEVRESNKAAIALYEKNGFKIVNVRKKYYDNEDALMMKRGD